MKCRSRLLVFLPLLFPALCLADFSGRVVRVVDGDTVQVLADGKMMKVRLNGIDAPESGQPFGQRSKQNLLKLAVPETDGGHSQQYRSLWPLAGNIDDWWYQYQRRAG
jgi:hypothetical protein